jgi:hypothetical protein
LFTRPDLRRYAGHEAGDAVGAMDRPPCGGDLATAVAGEDYVRAGRREQGAEVSVRGRAKERGHRRVMFG